MAEPTNNESVSQGCMRRMRGNRESMYGEYNKENLKPVPVVQILRWQGGWKGPILKPRLCKRTLASTSHLTMM